MTDSNEIVTKIHEVLAGATPEQVRYVMARIHESTDKAAAKKAGVHPNTVARWANKAKLDELVTLLLLDPLIAAVETLRLAAPAAASVLVGELKGRQKRQAANDVLDRAGIAKLTKVAPVTPDGKKSYQPLDLENLTDDEIERLGSIFAKIEI